MTVGEFFARALHAIARWPAAGRVLLGVGRRRLRRLLREYVATLLVEVEGDQPPEPPSGGTAAPVAPVVSLTAARRARLPATAYSHRARHHVGRPVDHDRHDGRGASPS